VTADDVGQSHDVNRAAREARERGVLTHASLSPGGRALDEAVAWVRSDPALGAGVHLDLFRFFRAEHGRSSALWAFQDPRVPVPAVLEEIAAQMKALADRNVPLSFVSSRAHLHLRPEILPLVCDVAPAFGIRAVRFSDAYAKTYEGKSPDRLRAMLQRRGFAACPHFIDGWYWGNVDEPFAWAELACRPSHADEGGRRDLSACCDARLREHLRRQGVEPASYKELAAEKPGAAEKV
jgi:hypothetical protein